MTDTVAVHFGVIDQPWPHSNTTSPAQTAGHETILLGTVTAPLSVLAVAIQKEAVGNHMHLSEKTYLTKMKEHKPLIYQRMRETFSPNALWNFSQVTMLMLLKQLDTALYGAQAGNNSSIPTTPPTTQETPTSPASKRVILINSYRGSKSTPTKAKPPTSSQSTMFQATGVHAW